MPPPRVPDRLLGTYLWARKKKESIRKKLFIALGFLAALQVALYVYISSYEGSGNTVTIEAIDKAVEESSAGSSDRKELLKVQIALSSYMNQNQGTPPANLQALVPTYLQSVPPGADGKPLQYRVEDKKYYLGDTQASSENKPNAGATTAKKGDSTGKGEGISEGDRETLLEVLQKDSDERLSHFDPTGKRDPFKPQNIAPDNGIKSGKTPLETYSLDKLNYSAYLQSEGEPKAIIENTDGRGFTVTKGTKVGPNNGVVTDIFPDRLIIVETTNDFTGTPQRKTFELGIGVKGTKTQK